MVGDSSVSDRASSRALLAPRAATVELTMM